MSQLLDFIIIGAQKSGSTFVHYCLEEHPHVDMPHREIHFFEDPNYDPDKVCQLQDLFAERETQQLRGIKRPRYFAAPECPARLQKHCPTARLLLVLRHPIDRAVSAYFHYMKYGFIPVKSVEEGLRHILHHRYDAQYPGGREIIEFGFYGRYLERYLHHFSKEQISVILFDDLQKEPLSTMQTIYKALGLNESYVPQSLDKKPQASIYSLPRLWWRSWRNPLIYQYDAKRTRSYRKSTGTAVKIVNKAILFIDSRMLKHVFKSQRPDLSKVMRQILHDLYLPEIEKVELLLGRDLSIWKT